MLKGTSSAARRHEGCFVIAGLAVGCTAPVKDLLFGPDPPLGFFSESLSIMAGAMIPSMMLVLGSVLHKGPGSAKVPKRVILGILAVRQIIIPMLGKMPIVQLRSRQMSSSAVLERVIMHYVVACMQC